MLLYQRYTIVIVSYTEGVVRFNLIQFFTEIVFPMFYNENPVVLIMLFEPMHIQNESFRNPNNLKNSEAKPILCHFTTIF